MEVGGKLWEIKDLGGRDVEEGQVWEGGVGVEL